MIRAALSCLCLVLAAGCGPAPPAVTPAHSEPGSELDVWEFQVDELSDLAAYLAEVDQGRLRIAPPIEWRVAPRSRDYLVRFVRFPDSASPLPRITVVGRDADTESTATDRAAVRAQLERLAAGIPQREAQAQEFSLLVLGDVPCLRYIVPRTFRIGERSFRGEREVLITVANRRRYTVTLDVHAGKLEDYRADAYAVMAGMQFLQPSGGNESPPPAQSATEGAPPDPPEP